MAGFQGGGRKFGGFQGKPKQEETKGASTTTKAEQKMAVGGGYMNKSKKGEDYMRLFIGDKQFVAFFVDQSKKKKETDPDIRIYESEERKS